MNTNTIQQQLPVNALLHGDCIEVMRQIPTNSVDFILTDPPYLVNYHDRSGRTILNDAKARLAQARDGRSVPRTQAGPRSHHVLRMDED